MRPSLVARASGCFGQRCSGMAMGEGGEEINQETFENAIGVGGIEQLVGVGVQETRTGWTFGQGPWLD